MGIKGIYKEIGSGKRISLCKIAVDNLEQTGRPFRLAIDISIWQFQAQAAKGGANPAIRTLFYRLVRLLALSIQPLFVFDGPNKPAYKRNKRSYGSGSSVANAMAKHLIRLFGFAIHDAPGEAEAECALLQQKGIVDAVLSEDVDTIMFGCSRTLRNWSAESKGGSAPTHVSMYDVAHLAQSESGLDREGMVLVAMMSGGDYMPAGVPGCGVKVACEAAKAGFGRSLCKIKKADKQALAAWKSNLLTELRTNGSGFFRTRHKALEIPEDFPDMDVLRYYTHPVVSQQTTVDRLSAEFPSQKPVNVPALRDFVRDNFDWTNKIGATKFIRVLAPSLLSQALLVPQQGNSQDSPDLIENITSQRIHFSTDATSELRVSYIPNNLVKLDLDAEPVEEVAVAGRDGLALNSDEEFEIEEQAKAPKKAFDPSAPDLVWIPETLVQTGAPHIVEAWRKKERVKALKAGPKKTGKVQSKAPDMPTGALDRYVKVTKGIATTLPSSSQTSCSTSLQPASQAKAASRASERINGGSSTMSSRASKPPPRRASKPVKTRTAAAGNPWTLAGSHISPSVTRPVSDQQLPALSKLAAPAPCGRHSRDEPIIISSSPIASPSPALVVPHVSTAPSRRRHSKSPERRGPRATSPSPTRASTRGRVGRRAPAAPSEVSPARLPRAFKRVKSAADEDFTHKQASITAYIIRDSSSETAKVKQSTKSLPVSLEPISLSDDDDDDDLFPPILPPTQSAKNPLWNHIPSSQKSHVLGSEDLPCFSQLSSSRPDDGETLVSDGDPPFDLTDIAPKNKAEAATTSRPTQGLESLPYGAALPRSLPLRKPSTRQDSVPPGKTTLYVPRKSGVGYFKKIEVDRDEADQILAGKSTHIDIQGSSGRILRRSDIGIVDLTGSDDEALPSYLKS